MILYTGLKSLVSLEDLTLNLGDNMLIPSKVELEFLG